MKRKDKNKKSKQLAYLLRHDSEGFKLGKIHSDGWRNVLELCEDYKFTKEEIRYIIESDEKERYELDQLEMYVRALQGHSIPVKIESIKEMTPPPYLYHGTQEKNLESILEKGLLKGSRLYVHLSADYETALKVGKRRSGPTIVLKIRAAEMCMKDNIKFFKSANGVWLCDYVDPKYIEYEEN